VWDVGTSIISTLKACLAKSGTARLFDSSVVNEFDVEAAGWKPSPSGYTTEWSPGVDSGEAEVLLASLLPGITRKAANAADEAELAEDTGYGMFALYHTALNTYRGSIEIRSERSTLYIDRPDSKSKFRVQLSTAEGGLAMTGNNVTVRIPVNDG
jgi:hypothetical protein